jgi:signal transduction histidine kinase
VKNIGHAEAIEDFALAKRKKLFERVSIFGIFMSLFHFADDLYQGAHVAPIVDILITIVLAFSFWLHRRGHENKARIIGLTFLNVCFAVYACIVPSEIGIYFYYFPLITISMAIFGKSERIMRAFFVLFSAGLLLSLFLSDFDLIGPFEIAAPNVEVFFLINLISSVFILIVSINFILTINEESEERLHILAEEVKSKNVDLQKTNAELDRFFYSTSHDLRSPLLSIKGLVNIAKNETADNRIKQYLTMMNDRTDKLDLFIKDIIDYSKNKRTEVRPEKLDVTKLVHEVQENFQFLEGAEKIQFLHEIQIQEAFTDKTRLTVILNNLISNAIKYHQLDQTEPWIKVKMHNGNQTLSIVVSDNGPGIDAERQSKIFDMFYRGTERSKGSGLGLYIVKETIAKMNGTIKVESVEGEGTSFIVKLPVSSNHNTKEISPAGTQQQG